MAQRFGLTWWGQRWIGALEALGSVYENRLPRGRTYARRGTVHDLAVAPGVVTARVDGSRARPYRVRIALPAFDDATWEQVVGALAGELRHAAALLEGRMPDDVDQTLHTCGVSLFPSAGELDTACSCPDWANPCKHVAAVHYVLATTFDADPFLLMELRGRDRDRLLGQLRTVRAGTGEEPPTDDRDDAPAVPLSALEARELFRPREPLSLDLRPDPDADPLAALHRLGPLPGKVGGAQPAVEAAVVATAELAWQLFAGDPGVEAE